MGKLKVVVLISGRGSNLKAIINKCSKKNVLAKVIGIISNNSNASGLKLTGDFKKIIIDNKLSKKRFETELQNNLEKLNPIQVIIKQLDYIKNLNTRFNGAVTLYFEKTKNKILRIDDILKSISPISTLDRGYAIVTDRKTKKIIKNANHLKIGKKIHVKLASSEIDSTVDKIYEK